MVQLCVKIPDGSSCGEWAILELQGDLETKSEAASLSGKFIGDLHFTCKGEPMLIVGHHILYGKLLTLDRPMIALNKRCPSSQHEVTSMKTDNQSQISVEDNMTRSSQKVDQTEYSVTAVIRKKLLFKTRPKPIIANVPKKLS